MALLGNVVVRRPEWWVAGATAARAEDADVELDEVERFYTERDLWNRLA